MNTILYHSILFISMIWPLLLAFLFIFKQFHSKLLYFTPWAALPALLAVAISSTYATEFELPSLLVGGSFALDETGKIFMLLATLLWTLSGVYAKSYFKSIENKVSFYRYFLLAMAGNFILILAQDMISFYVGFTLMSFASYGLIVFNKTALSFKAGLVYISLVVLGEVILFSGLLMIASTSESTLFSAVPENIILDSSHDLIICLIFIGFGLKAGVFGLHVWLPLAHPEAPAPASAVLSGTMIKAGILGWIRFLPVGTIALPEWGTAIIILGFFTAFYGVIIGLTQRDPKTVLAYSSISQVGIITMSIGLGMQFPEVWSVVLTGIAFYALHHGLSKGALFLGVGLFGSKQLKQRVWVWLGLWLPALAIAGAPWTSGMLAKDLVKSYTLYVPAPWDTLLPLLLSGSALATALLMARLLYLLRPSAEPYGSKPSIGLILPWSALLLTIILVPWLGVYSFEYAMNKEIFGSLWPILLSLMISIGVYRMHIFNKVKPIPAGDILVWIELGLILLKNNIKKLHNLTQYLTLLQEDIQRIFNAVQTLFSVKLRQSESFLVRWEVAITLMVLMMSVVVFISFKR
ncbi:MAG: Formate hydrogenlyase subunit 3/multisubunit Na+/H+ antiporter MnhD subunit [uncultured Sulfurovum sp.]|uniref:Formate hydrogenlyase subunit 3/multisubunit Na+/H+ antiporter MnhD subunit n=1 Tax=uncultured Sulfurovum sp. TaxID=269237 RepID=A0A6S6SGJ0_9BACT|nr:MAG: Formate hydrogenlyase subunit 3/multisubunit Na+/H+ antiporter MnhD subunit [uncultured Sulfurovum sp.]